MTRSVYHRRRLRSLCVRCADPVDGRALCHDCHRYHEDRRRNPGARWYRCGVCGETGHTRRRCQVVEVAS